MKTVQRNYSTIIHEEFENLILEAVDESLSSLGDSAKQAIYYHLEKSFRLKREDIPHRIDEFATAMERIFGYGGKLLQIQIMKRLHEKVGRSSTLYLKEDGLFFAEYVRAQVFSTS